MLPDPPIPNVVFQPGAATPGEVEYLKGPVAPSCEAPLIPGALHAALSIPFRAIGLVATPLMAGQCPPSGPCDCDLGEAAYVTHRSLYLGGCMYSAKGLQAKISLEEVKRYR